MPGGAKRFSIQEGIHPKTPNFDVWSDFVKWVTSIYIYILQRNHDIIMWIQKQKNHLIFIMERQKLI